MTQAKEIFNQYGIGKFMMGDVAGKAKVIAALNEALNLNADKVKNLENSCVVWSQKYGLLELEVAHLKKRNTELEEENKRLREGHKEDVIGAYNDARARHDSTYIANEGEVEDYYNEIFKNFTNE